MGIHLSISKASKEKQMGGNRRKQELYRLSYRVFVRTAALSNTVSANTAYRPQNVCVCVSKKIRDKIAQKWVSLLMIVFWATHTCSISIL